MAQLLGVFDDPDGRDPAVPDGEGGGLEGIARLDGQEAGLSRQAASMSSFCRAMPARLASTACMSRQWAQPLIRETHSFTRVRSASGMERCWHAAYDHRWLAIARTHIEQGFMAMNRAVLAHWTMHDLRRTMRTGLTALGVDSVVAEMMLNHQIGDELQRIYDRHGYPEKRIEAAQAWADHVLGLVEAARARVVTLPARAGGSVAGVAEVVDLPAKRSA